MSTSSKGTAVLLAHVDEKRGTLILNEDALKLLAPLEAPLHVYLHVGPTRIGKSSLANLHIRSVVGSRAPCPFVFKGGPTSVTRGLYMWVYGSHVWLDMEGDDGRGREGRQRLFAWAVAALATQVTFHFWGVIHNDDMDRTGMLTYVAESLKGRLVSSTSSSSTGKISSTSSSNVTITTDRKEVVVNVPRTADTSSPSSSSSSSPMASIHQYFPMMPKLTLLVARGGSDAYRSVNLDHELDNFLLPTKGSPRAKLIRDAWPSIKLMVLGEASASEREWLSTMDMRVGEALPRSSGSSGGSGGMNYWPSVYALLQHLTTTSSPKSWYQLTSGSSSSGGSGGTSGSSSSSISGASNMMSGAQLVFVARHLATYCNSSAHLGSVMPSLYEAMNQQFAEELLARLRGIVLKWERACLSTISMAQRQGQEDMDAVSKALVQQWEALNNEVRQAVPQHGSSSHPFLRDVQGRVDELQRQTSDNLNNAFATYCAEVDARRAREERERAERAAKQAEEERRKQEALAEEQRQRDRYREQVERDRLAKEERQRREQRQLERDLADAAARRREDQRRSELAAAYSRPSSYSSSSSSSSSLSSTSDRRSSSSRDDRWDGWNRLDQELRGYQTSRYHQDITPPSSPYGGTPVHMLSPSLGSAVFGMRPPSSSSPYYNPYSGGYGYGYGQPF